MRSEILKSQIHIKTILTTAKNKFHNHSESQFLCLGTKKKECLTWYFNIYFYEGPFLLTSNTLTASIYFLKSLNLI